uniref:Secreted protein n=1 Tax=Anopheles minimus TaxID=112268 RepID=A0A182WQ72_9DIPT
MDFTLHRLMALIVWLLSTSWITFAVPLEYSHRTSHKRIPGRVEMRVYRGPVDHYTGSVPWGYFVRQPANHSK